MKKIGIIGLLSIVVFCVDAKLAIRRNYFGDRVARIPYSERMVDRRGWYEPTSIADAEDEVNRLRMQNIHDYDKGTYMAIWAKRRSRALDIQTKLGYTVPERYTWGW